MICQVLNWILWSCIVVRPRICRSPESLTRIWKQTASLTFDKHREETVFSIIYHFQTAGENIDLFQTTWGNVSRLNECAINDHWMSNDYRYAYTRSIGILFTSIYKVEYPKFSYIVLTQSSSSTCTQNQSSIITLKNSLTFWEIH